MSRRKRYAIIMLISVNFNTVFYLNAHYWHLPVWLDLQGTAFAAEIFYLFALIFGILKFLGAVVSKEK